MMKEFDVNQSDKSAQFLHFDYRKNSKVVNLNFFPFIFVIVLFYVILVFKH